MEYIDAFGHERRLHLYWTTKDGTRIALDKLTDSHLANIERHIQQRITGYTPAGLEEGPQGEDVIDEYDRELADLERWLKYIQDEISYREKYGHD